jgi:hypothetical protein
MVTALKLTVGQLEALPEDDNRYELIDGEFANTGWWILSYERSRSIASKKMFSCWRPRYESRIA